MDTLIYIWNLLWEYQVVLVFPLVLVVWIAVRGYDLGNWIRKKIRKKPLEEAVAVEEAKEQEPPQADT